VARFGGVEQPFLNDAVLQRDAHEKMIEYAVDVGGKYMTAGKADGLIVASPTGSTAYNLSTGGPIVYPTVESLVLAPIAPHKLSFRPVVIPADEVVVTLRSPQAHLSLDGRANGVLKVGDKLIIRRSPHSLNLLHDAKRNFFDLLRLKLGWDLPAGLQ
jgi:NAD+ kinase